MPMFSTTGFAATSWSRSIYNRNRTTYTYDPVGQRRDMCWVYGTVNVFATQSYDPVGRMVASLDASSLATSYAYDQFGRVVSVQNGLGNRTSSVYDAAGRTVAEVNPLGFRTTQGYDALGRRISVQDAVNNFTTSQYDSRGLLLSEQSGWGAFTTMSYDPAGNEVLRIDGRGWPTTNTYDALDRIYLSLAPDGALTTYQYDANSREIALWNRASLVTNTYDAVGQTLMAVAQSAIDSTVATLSYSLDGIGQRTLMVDGEGHRTTYSYLSPSATASQVTIQPPYEPNGTIVQVNNRGQVLFRGMHNYLASYQLNRYLANDWFGYNTFNTRPSNDEQNFFESFYDGAGNRSRMEERPGIGTSAYNTWFSYDKAN